MNFILTLLVAARGMFLLGGALAGSTVAISEPRLVLSQRAIFLDCSLQNAFSLPELRHLAHTGTTVAVYLIIETREPGRARPVGRVTAENTIRFDAVTGRFLVVRRPARDSLEFGDGDSALARLGLFEGVKVVDRAVVEPGGVYHFVITAVLGSARIEALDNSTIDLMYFWKYRRPTIRTQGYRGAELFPAPDGSAYQ